MAELVFGGQVTSPKHKSNLENSSETFRLRNPSIGSRENCLSILPFRLVEPFPTSVNHPAK
jgi:hypothetical protein